MPSCTYCGHDASCCAVPCDTLLTGSGEHGHGVGVEPAGDLRDQGQAVLAHGGDQLRCLPCRSATQRHRNSAGDATSGIGIQHAISQLLGGKAARLLLKIPQLLLSATGSTTLAAEGSGNSGQNRSSGGHDHRSLWAAVWRADCLR